MNARVLRALCTGAALTTIACVPVAFTPPAAAADSAVAADFTARAHPTRTVKAGPIQLSILSVTPSSPAVSHTPRPLVIGLRVRNTTDEPLGEVKITATRGDPIANQTALNAALAKPTPPTSGLAVAATKPVWLDVAAGATVDTTFTTTTAITLDAALCLCSRAAVYPLFFSIHRTGPTPRDSSAQAASDVLGTAVTYLPSFYATPAPVGVSWVWPLIDRPHRLSDAAVFTDDSLASSVGTDGRLSRALAVIEQVEHQGSMPITLLVDPELLDELTVMTGRYAVRTGKRTLPGSGQDVAGAWLARLATLLEGHPEVSVQLTPYADPDIQSLSGNHLHWASGIPPQLIPGLRAALAGRPMSSSVSWPPSNTITDATLDTLSHDGVRTVILGSGSVTPRDGAGGAVPAGLARLVRHTRVLTAAVTSPAVQRYAAAVISQNAGDAAVPGTAQLPPLVAEVAVRAAQDPATSHALVITPPRYVDPDPAAAVRAIRDTSIAPFARPIALNADTEKSRLPIPRSRLALARSTTSLSRRLITSAHEVSTAVPKIDSLLADGRGAATALLAGLPLALQRTESAYWGQNPTAGAEFGRDLTSRVRALIGGVDIVRPSTGTYTLASSNSPLPITLENKLGFPVRLRLRVATVNATPGFVTADVGVQNVGRQSKRTIHLPTKIDRSGRIQITAQLMTPNDRPLGKPIPLSVHSTALGAVGVVITVVAGAILVLALLLRGARQLRKRARPGTRPRSPGVAS